MRKVILGAVLLSATATVAAEPELPERYAYIGGHVTHYYFDTNGHVSDAGDLDSVLLPGVQLGYRFQSDWSVQALYEFGEPDREQGSGDVDLDTAVIEARRHFSNFDLAGFEPYTGVAVGHHEFSPGGGDVSETLAGIGVGVQRAVTENIFFDVGARHDFIFDDDKRQDTQLYVGVNYAFSTAGGNDSGQAIRQEPTEPTEPKDSDNDGVPDQKDACPTTTAQAEVDNSGCVIRTDSDNDGVTDPNDQCPGTPEGAQVTDQGCHKTLEKSVRETLDVRFETASSTVTEDSVSQVRDLADVMREFPESTVVLEGHTDNVGDAEANRELSQRRAEAVKAILVEDMGIAAGRVQAEGYGESRPVADNATAEGRAQNRRVEAVFEASKELKQYKD